MTLTLRESHSGETLADSIHDVIVVGARVAGAATAMLLARRGLNVLLLDRAPAAGSDTLSTHALMRAGVVQLHRWGLLPHLAHAATPPVRRTRVYYGDEVEDIEIQERAGVGSLFAPRRTVLDPLLVDAARRAGADVRYGIAVEDLVVSGGRVRGVVARDRSGAQRTLRAPLVVGADGLRSLVAQRTGAPMTWQGTAASGFVYGYWEGLETDGYEWFYRRDATAGIIPTNDGRTCVWIGARADALGRDLHDGLAAAFARRLELAAPEVVARLAAARPAERLRGFPGVPGFLRRAHGPGFALVGDASSFRDPITAHGITDALRDADLLADATVAALDRPLREDEAMADYEARRDEVALPMARISDRVASYDWTIPEVRELLLDLSKVMAREARALAERDAIAGAA